MIRQEEEAGSLWWGASKWMGIVIDEQRGREDCGGMVSGRPRGEWDASLGLCVWMGS